MNLTPYKVTITYEFIMNASNMHNAELEASKVATKILYHPETGVSIFPIVQVIGKAEENYLDDEICF